VTVEQALGGNQSLSVAYIGALGRDLLRVNQFFNVNPSFQTVGITDNSTTSDYHALQAKFECRLSHGLQALASYEDGGFDVSNLFVPRPTGPHSESGSVDSANES
jgi:hypothetical protein